jgi:hypothetical protein
MRRGGAQRLHHRLDRRKQLTQVLTPRSADWATFWIAQQIAYSLAQRADIALQRESTDLEKRSLCRWNIDGPVDLGCGSQAHRRILSD